MRLKNFYKIFLFFSTLSVIFLPILFEVKNTDITSKKKFNYNNILLPDAISPLCDYLGENNDINNNEIDKIEIKIPESRGWYKNMILASVSNSGGIIRERYKKKFIGSIFFKDKGLIKCFGPIKVRISGDSKEHIEINGDEIYSSLDLRLLKDNLHGIVKFKLFIPKTRNGDSEVITAAILEELGYLSPRTRNINVQINKTNLNMILQEKAAKEMFEHNKLRESAIVESNESLLWQLRTKGLGRSFNSLLFPKILNSKWLNKSELNKKVSLKALNILSNAIHESWHDQNEEENSFSDLILSNGNTFNEGKLSSYRIHILSMGAYHSLINHNRRFYYDAFNETLKPIYYDGNSKVINYSKSELEKDLDLINSYNMLREISLEDTNNALKELSLLKTDRLKILLDARGVYISEIKLDQILKNMKNNINFLKNNLVDFQQISWGRDPLKKYVNYKNNYGIAFSKEGNLFNMCNMKIASCKNIYLNFEDSSKILSEKLNFEELDYFYYGKEYEYFKNPKLVISNKRLGTRLNSNKIKIKTIGKTTYNFDEKNKVINIKTYYPNDRVVIFDSDLEAWNLNLVALNNDSEKISPLSNRYDENLLTGILTIKDTKLNKVTIKIDGGKAEDSLNIIRSRGNIDKIEVINSYQDAVDFDFSDLEIASIYIKNAGNDCLDFSLGNYKIKDIKAYNCFDKGISVGEKSKVSIDNIFLESSNINIVSKDSSKLYVKGADFKYYKLCAAVYRKKQEFSGAFLEIPHDKCENEKIIVQDESILKLKK